MVSTVSLNTILPDANTNNPIQMIDGDKKADRAPANDIEVGGLSNTDTNKTRIPAYPIPPYTANSIMLKSANSF